VTNDSSTSAQNVTISDSSGDGTIGTASYILSSTGKVADVSASLSSLAPSATAVTYVASFQATDAINNGYPSNGFAKITLTAPSGTSFSSTSCDYYVYDDDFDAGEQCLTPVLGNSGATATLSPGFNIPAGDMVTVVAEGVTSDAATTAQSLGVSTTSDPSAQTAAYTLSSKGKILDVALQLSSHAAGATDVTYSATFVATDGLTNGVSTVTLAAPTGTVFDAGGGGGECNIVYSYDHTTGADNNCANLTVSNGGATLTIGIDINVGIGDSVTINVEGVTNATPATLPTTEKLKISTSSDPKAAKGKYVLR
jgi:hypothetical protein